MSVVDAPAARGGSVGGRPASARTDAIIGAWLLVMCAMVFIMVVLGGVTRLTHSGLSMVEWKPLTGWLPPLTHEHWVEVFEKYKQFPEYQKLNKGMTLGEFQGIFWLEFLHRLWGRLMGVAFAVPLAVFVVKGWVRRDLLPKLLLMFVLGGLQGGLGWFMVASGLVDHPDVSQYRLTAHLAAALVIYGFMFWVALGLLLPTPAAAEGAAGRRLSALAPWLAGWAFLTILSGGFVAGLDAGLTYNTFPLMDGDLVPDGLFMLSPAWINPFENITTVQFDHRLLAEGLFVLVAGAWLASRRARLAPRARLAVNLLALAVAAQVGLGIATLLLVVPVPLAAGHQAMAVMVLTAALFAVRELRGARPRA